MSILRLHTNLPAALYNAGACSLCATARPHRRRLQTARHPACQLGRCAPPHPALSQALQHLRGPWSPCCCTARLAGRLP